MKLPDSLRDQLKVPLGVLLPDDKVSKENVEKFLDDDSYVITVGDRTTERMIEFGLVPSVQIIDGIEKTSTQYTVNLNTGLARDANITYTPLTGETTFRGDT